MDTSLTRYKGIAWFENIYQRFEAMCQEVDEIMQQVFNLIFDAYLLNLLLKYSFVGQNISKHAEIQLETVGANVKNFCSESELKGDALHQSSVDIEEREAPDLSLVQNTDDAASPEGTNEDCGKRSIDGAVPLSSVKSVKSVYSGLSLEEIDDIETKKFQLQTSDNKDSSNAWSNPAVYHKDQKIELGGGANMLFPASDDVGGCNSFMETEDRSSNLVVMSSNISDDIQFSNYVNLAKPCKRRVTGIEPCPPGTSDIPNSYLTTPATQPSLDGNELYDSLDKSESAVSLPLYDSLDESESAVSLPDSGLQSLQSPGKVKLEESCILVECTGLQCSSCEAVKCRSYKKKIRDAFASKMRVLKKHNHEQLTDWSAELDARFDQQKRKSFTTPTHSEKSDSLDYEFCESDWEIV